MESLAIKLNLIFVFFAPFCGHIKLNDKYQFFANPGISQPIPPL